VILAVASPAFAAGRVPSGVTHVSVTLTSAPTSSGANAPKARTFTKAASVSQIVRAANALPVATIRGACPMIMRFGPELTVVFRDSRGTAVAEVTVQVVVGTKGDSGSSNCFPIHFIRGNQGQSLVGNGFVRMMGRMLGTTIS
jgi:hypothetical protein